MATWIIGIVLLLIVVLIVRDMVSKRRRGQCAVSCGGNCAHCPSHCAGGGADPKTVKK